MVAHTPAALHAIHRLIIQGRWLAGEGMSGQQAVGYFDELDGLMGYVVAWGAQDKTDMFEWLLEKVCTTYQARHIYEEYKRKTN